MSNSLYSFDRAAHSDFLVHWTGRDIDSYGDHNWCDRDHKSITSQSECEKYVKRLKDILTYGLWLTEEDARTYFVGSKEVTIPPSPQCCFTELKLSEARRHAARYGRLGIGVKRPFLFNRFGRPMIYFGFDASATNDKFLNACLADITDKSLLNYFKPMNSNNQILNYDFYSESEWRIILFNELIDKEYIKDPSDHRNKDEFEYYKGLSDQEKSKLKYLLPLDHWFSLIIYPSVDVKVMCQEGNGEYISNQIKRIKSERGASDSTPGGGWPIELDLDACRNF